MNFSPEYLAMLLIRPLRHLFEYYAPDDLKWTDNPKTSGIEIDTINNYNKVPIQVTPRIMVSRGQYSVQPVGLSDNMVSRVSPWAGKGHKESIHKFFINGTAQIMIQARQEGACEKVLNLTQHFLAWTGPMLADAYGFKTSFVPMAVSPCIPGKEDTETFTTTINLPWSKEEHWMVKADDEIKIKNFLLTIVPKDSP